MTRVTRPAKGDPKVKNVATLELRCGITVGDVPAPVVGQLRGPMNREVNKPIRDAVQAWLETPGISFKPHPVALSAAGRFRHMEVNG